MEQFIMKGGNPLVGEVTIGGAKNAALGILAASIMTDRESARRKRYQCTAGSDPGDWSFCGPDRPAHSKN